MDSVGCLYGMYTYDDLEPYELEVDPWKDETVSEPKIFKGLVTLRKLLVGIDILTALAHVDLGDTSLVKRLLLNLEHLYIRGYQLREDEKKDKSGNWWGDILDSCRI